MPPTTTNGADRRRPKYDPPEPSYATGSAHNLQIYLDFMQAQITELLTNYGPVAAIWLDGVAVPNNGDKAKFKSQELYDYIHSVQPQVLVSYKQGLLGTEDFQAPEHQAVEQANKPMEICTTMCSGPGGKGVSWGYLAEGGHHKNEEEVWQALTAARESGCNLLLNTGPLPDGSLDEKDVPVPARSGRTHSQRGISGRGSLIYRVSSNNRHTGTPTPDATVALVGNCIGRIDHRIDQRNHTLLPITTCTPSHWSKA